MIPLLRDQEDLSVPTLDSKLQVPTNQYAPAPLTFGAADELACRLPIPFTAMQLALWLRPQLRRKDEPRPLSAHPGVTMLSQDSLCSSAGDEIVSRWHPAMP